MQTLLQWLVRWVEFVALTTVVGGLVSRALLVPGTLACRPAFVTGLDRALLTSIALLAVTSVADLLLRTLTMSQQGLAHLGGALPLVLRHTHYGSVWIARMGLVGSMGLLCWLERTTPFPRSWRAWASLAGALLLPFTISLAGHAADWGSLTVPVVIDWLHVLAVSTWIGGLFTIGMLFPRAVGAASKGEAGDELSIAATRFSHIAICCTALFLATGWLNARLQVASLAPLLSTWYGRTLLIKLWLLALALFVAARNRYWLLPRLVRDPGATATPSEARLEQTGDLRATRASRHACPDVQERFLRAVRLEWVLAAGILACSALLTQLQPARHIRRHEHREPHPVHRPTGATPELAVARPAMRAISLPPTMASALGGAVVHRRSPGRMSHHE